VSEKPRLLVVFYSRSGVVEGLANALAEGAREAGAEVRLRRARELVGPEVMALAPGWTDNAARMNALYKAPTADDMRWADGYAFGAPTRFASASSELRGFLESLGALWLSNELKGKPAGVFTACSAPHGGLETTALGLWPTLAHLGMIIVPTGYGHALSRKAGTPYGAGSVSRGAPSEDEAAIAHYQGGGLAAVANLLRPLRAA